MKTIHKYQIANDTRIEMPKDAEVIHVTHRQGNLFVWAIVNTDQIEKEMRRFATFRTGDNIDQSLKLKYIGTSKLISDLMIFHTFEVIS